MVMTTFSVAMTAISHHLPQRSHQAERRTI
jgi:hypothetical protein